VNIDDIETLIKLFDRSGLGELELEQGETKLVLRRTRPDATGPVQMEASGGQRSASPDAAPDASRAASAPPQPEDAEHAPAPNGGAAEDEKAAGYVVTSPIVGTFYRRPSPEEEPYVTVGDRVDAGDTVCIVEAMKVMNEVRTERAGIVKEILVEDAAAVEYGQALIRIDES
jgi:acetyl-CoA carboxylase biotin carboxyl carrier protein